MTFTGKVKGEEKKPFLPWIWGLGGQAPLEGQSRSISVQRYQGLPISALLGRELDGDGCAYKRKRTCWVAAEPFGDHRDASVIKTPPEDRDQDCQTDIGRWVCVPRCRPLPRACTASAVRGLAKACQRWPRGEKNLQARLLQAGCQTWSGTPSPCRALGKCRGSKPCLKCSTLSYQGLSPTGKHGIQIQASSTKESCDSEYTHGPQCRYVRQGTELWDSVREGVCTTGILNDALGVYEPAACQTLGLPHFYASHHKLLRAYDRLQEPIYCPPTRVPKEQALAASHAQAGLHCSLFGSRQGWSSCLSLTFSCSKKGVLLIALSSLHVLDDHYQGPHMHCPCVASSTQVLIHLIMVLTGAVCRESQPCSTAHMRQPSKVCHPAASSYQTCPMLATAHEFCATLHWSHAKP